MEKLEINLDEKYAKKIKQIAEYSQRDVSAVVEDLIKTFCILPVIVSSDLEEFCIKQLERCDSVDQHRKSTFTDERIKSYERIRYFIDLIYNTQINLIKQYENK